MVDVEESQDEVEMWLFSITWEGQLLTSHVFACQTPHLPRTKCQGNLMAPKEHFAKVDRTTWSTTIQLKSNCINKSPQVRTNRKLNFPPWHCPTSLHWLVALQKVTHHIPLVQLGWSNDGEDGFWRTSRLFHRDLSEGLRPRKITGFYVDPDLDMKNEYCTPMNGLLIFVITVLWVNTLQFLGSKWSMTPKATFSWREKVFFDCFFCHIFTGKGPFDEFCPRLDPGGFLWRFSFLLMPGMLRHDRLYFQHVPKGFTVFRVGFWSGQLDWIQDFHLTQNFPCLRFPTKKHPTKNPK